jgi:hypothetical protein
LSASDSITVAVKEDGDDDNGDVEEPADKSDTDGDGLPDQWEFKYFDHLSECVPDEDVDGDGLTNIEERDLEANLRIWGLTEFLDPTKADTDADGINDKAEVEIRFSRAPDKTPPSVLKVGPGNKTVPPDTPFYVLIKDSGGINLQDKDSIVFAVKYAGEEYTRCLADQNCVRVSRLENLKIHAGLSEKLLVMYLKTEDRDSGESVKNYPWGAKVNIRALVKDINGNAASENCAFTIRTQTEQEAADQRLPAASRVSLADGWKAVVISEGELSGARVSYSGGEGATPYFGSTADIPDLEDQINDAVGVGLPLNLQPAAIFSSAGYVSINIPCPGYEDASGLSVYCYDGGRWFLACDKHGTVLPEAADWMAAGSRVNHNNGDPSSIEIKVRHFSGAQAGFAGGDAPAADDHPPPAPDSGNGNSGEDEDENMQCFVRTVSERGQGGG